jgi:uncharacterized caspase-like protein
MSRRCFGLVCLMALPLAPIQAAEYLGTPAKRADVAVVDLPGRLFVLAVGINAYPAKERLTYAVKDARDVTQALRTSGRKVYREVEAKLLTDKEADRQGILEGLAWLQREVTPQDTTVIFYSGHGAKHPAVGFFLVPARFRDGQPLQTMISGAELKHEAKQIRGSVVLLLDCCYAGAILNEKQRVPVLSPLQMLALEGAPVTVTPSEAPPGPAILCAARAREESEENDAIHHGIFTKVLLQGLSGKADLNHDGVVTLGEVERFIKQRLTKASKGQQHAISALSSLPPTTPLARP